MKLYTKDSKYDGQSRFLMDGAYIYYPDDCRCSALVLTISTLVGWAEA